MHRQLFSLRTSIIITTTTTTTRATRLAPPILPTVTKVPTTPFQLANRSSRKRFFSSTPPQRSKMYEYLVTIPDHANALAKRLAARPTHLAKLKPHIESGKVVFGGACLSRQPEEGEGPDMTGSVMLIRANSEEEVREWVESDEYTKQGAWDTSRMTITPFRCAIRTAM